MLFPHFTWSIHFVLFLSYFSTVEHFSLALKRFYSPLVRSYRVLGRNYVKFSRFSALALSSRVADVLPSPTAFLISVNFFVRIWPLGVFFPRPIARALSAVHFLSDWYCRRFGRSGTEGGGGAGGPPVWSEATRVRAPPKATDSDRNNSTRPQHPRRPRRSLSLIHRHTLFGAGQSGRKAIRPDVRFYCAGFSIRGRKEEDNKKQRRPEIKKRTSTLQRLLDAVAAALTTSAAMRSLSTVWHWLWLNLSEVGRSLNARLPLDMQTEWRRRDLHRNPSPRSKDISMNI